MNDTQGALIVFGVVVIALNIIIISLNISEIVKHLRRIADALEKNEMTDNADMPPCPWCESHKSRKCSRHPDGQDAPPKRTSPFAWASIAGADPEPVEIDELNGNPCLYTIGCQDIFLLSDPTVTLYIDELRRPQNLLTQEQINKLEREWRLNASIKHSWRGPR